ncbi:MAG: 4-hydroxythreonine-4-phosphate dehydrogenase PdxA [Gammaproteobacteria bacterium]|nr:4-hydroxythreonine-4-phosphate dehydrogenase PdxA [Gammaproteobacteria bacterium]
MSGRAPALTPGEPAGIGPDITLAAASAGREPFIAFADPEMLHRRAESLGLDIRIRVVNSEIPASRAIPPGELPVVPIAAPGRVVPGRLDAANSTYVVESIRAAVAACRDGTVAGLVTAPVHKGIINDAGIAFTGHTELLAELDGGVRPVMMLCTPGLRVALATTHLPLRAVPDAIDRAMLMDVVRVVERDLRTRFAIEAPRIMVCGLNPHAGEGGHLGREEIESVTPAVEALRAEGVDVRGPVPADTAFTPERLTGADVVVAMYHDQGLPVLKHAGFGQAVNVTLGLSFVRTSVDHGTALDLAGTGRAEHSSLVSALSLARELAREPRRESTARRP